MDHELANWLWYTIGLPSTALTRESFLDLAKRIMDAQRGFEEYRKRKGDSR